MSTPFYTTPNDTSTASHSTQAAPLDLTTALRVVARFVFDDCPSEIARDVLESIDIAAIPLYAAQAAFRAAQARIMAGDELVTADAIRATADEQAILFAEDALTLNGEVDRAEAVVFLHGELRAIRLEAAAEAGDKERRALLLAEDAGDRGNAMCIVALAAGDFRYTDSLGWLQWTGTHWSGAAAEADVQNFASDVLQERYDVSTGKDYEHVHKEAKPATKRVRDALWQARSRLYGSTDDLGRTENLLNVANGTVDLETGNLYRFDRAAGFTYCVSTPYQRAARSQLWEDSLFDWFGGDEDLIGFVQMAIGYSLTGSVREECGFYMYGPGRSGKGTLINTVGQILGAPLARGISFDVFTGGKNDPQNFRLAPLWNARLVMASEGMRNKRLDEDTAKLITGRDEIQVAFKGKTSFGYTPQFKFWLANNWPIRGDASDDAFWARFHVIPFRKSHLGREDKTLKDRLLLRENRMGVLAWAIAGAQQWYQWGLTAPADSVAEKAAHRLAADSVYAWVQENLVKTGSMADEIALDLAYRLFTEDGNELRKDEFSRRLNGYGFATKRTGRGESRQRVLTYCKLAED